jgi:predicted NAD/FAD-dependent oxidoreductase
MHTPRCRSGRFRFLRLLASFVTGCLVVAFLPAPRAQEPVYDIVIYGGTSAGVAAAIQATRMNKSVVLLEPGTRLGGLTSGGLGQTDIGNKQAIGGISREFYGRVAKHYSDPAAWRWQKREEYRDSGQTRTDADEAAMWTFEPGVALKIFNAMITEAKIPVVYRERIDLKRGVGNRGPPN